MAASVDPGTSQNSQISHTSFLDSKDDGDDQGCMGESQESFTQHELSQTHELTQLGFDEDDSMGPSIATHSPLSPAVDPLTLPWGRLIRQTNSGAIELTPRPPTGSITRSKSPNFGRSPSPLGFMGLRNLNPGDRFNEYILGRSNKVDIPAPKMLGDETKQPIHDYAHSSISNRHCRIFCILGSEMEVYVEDTSGNGTWINNTTLLRKNERRKLHTGDVICLVNPSFLLKKIRSAVDRKLCMDQYSYVFVNLYEQEARIGITPKSCGRGAVNPRAVRMHSTQSRNRPRDAGKQQQSQQKSLGSFLNHDPAKSRRIEEEYDIRDQLGTGTCGEVRRAIHRRSGNERAVKIIKIGDRRGGVSAGQFSSQKLKAIQAEAEILRSLDHPYVVKLFDVYVSPGKAIYLVMELLRGGDLYDRIIAREKYTEVQARRLLRRVLAAVYHLHEERGIVHRDLKPENILMANRKSDTDIKLTDFGVAKNMTAEGLKTFCGTPQYFAPEVLKRCNTVKGTGSYGKEIDCWSIGVILFILLSGSPPFDVTADYDAVANGKIKFYEDQWKDVSFDARDLVMKLLQRDPVKRMSVKDACEHVWILKEDGDTHCHPLQDPIITGMTVQAKTATSKTYDEDDTADLSEELLPESNQIASIESAAASLEDSNSCEQEDTKHNSNFNSNSHGETFTSINNDSDDTEIKSSASNQPKKSDTPTKEQEHANNHKKDRHDSILPYENSKAFSTAISQAMNVSLTSPSAESPIYRKKLFAKDAEAQDTSRKISLANAESIKSAGESLPKPVLQSVNVNRPKKEKGINSYFSAIPAKGKVLEPNSKLSAIEKKREHESSTITPPVGQALVFSLSKRIKIDPKHKQSKKENRQGVPFMSKAELSEDELQSDFSDAEDVDESGINRKRASTQIQQLNFTHQLSKNKVTNSASFTANVAAEKVEHKKIQSYLFGKPPPDTKITQNDQDDDLVDDNNMDESNELRAVSSEGNTDTVNINLASDLKDAPKGNQKTIKSWFRPKT